MEYFFTLYTIRKTWIIRIVYRFNISGYLSPFRNEKQVTIRDLSHSPNRKSQSDFLATSQHLQALVVNLYQQSLYIY